MCLVLVPPSALLFFRGPWQVNLTPSIEATMGASMVRAPWPFAIWAGDKLWQGQMMMRTSLPLPGV